MRVHNLQTCVFLPQTRFLLFLWCLAICKTQLKWQNVSWVEARNLSLNEGIKIKIISGKTFNVLYSQAQHVCCACLLTIVWRTVTLIILEVVIELEISSRKKIELVIEKMVYNTRVQLFFFFLNKRNLQLKKLQAPKIDILMKRKSTPKGGGT